MTTALEDLAKQAKAAKELIDSVSHIIELAGRSAIIEVTNVTSQPIRIIGRELRDGAFGIGATPADVIAPMTTGVFGAMSSTVSVVGTEGVIVYALDDQGTTLRIRWNVPFVGGNDASLNIEGPNKDLYAFSHQFSGGNKKVSFKFWIGEHATFGATDPDWMPCGQCKSLTYRLDEGKCPGHVTGTGRLAPDGTTWIPPVFHPHSHRGSAFALHFGVPGPMRQSGWKKCMHCKQLFYDGAPEKGSCPNTEVRGHVAEDGGREYILQYNVMPRLTQQSDWRFCTKCFVLFYLPQNEDAECLSGGKHQAHALNYVLDRV